MSTGLKAFANEHGHLFTVTVGATDAPKGLTCCWFCGCSTESRNASKPCPESS